MCKYLCSMKKGQRHEKGGRKSNKMEYACKPNMKTIFHELILRIKKFKTHKREKENHVTFTLFPRKEKHQHLSIFNFSNTMCFLEL